METNFSRIAVLNGGVSKGTQVAVLFPSFSSFLEESRSTEFILTKKTKRELNYVSMRSIQEQ